MVKTYPTAECQRPKGSPKPEGRNPKEDRIPKVERRRPVCCHDLTIAPHQFTHRIFDPRASDFFRISAFGFRICLIFPILGFAFTTSAQPATPPANPDPLMSLMLSQPKIDVESPVVPTASFEPPVVRTGESTTYRITLNALEESIELPNKITAPTNLIVRAGAHAQILAVTGMMLHPRTTFTYRLQATELGQFSIP